ncbi:ABC transporter ATP-binding protein [Craterilacuibacter sinensis]|uniref:ATP-binding cassette domain-containing protein n=1 Tax=Craterilacuibacter sinensis TaxID=2686017 RepID=A0A845BP48_9NEIS|nr:ABC transporter ATP-binding protein [Craterilacuibacter sinensis]MXR36056.1 ATP-binding cassette domain-containing protein [Craterilacuibacter sinensis]
MPHAVTFDHVSRLFGQMRAVDNVSLTINEGEFFSMLGPSGSGKTTCLRLIAGFELPSSGRILIAGQDASALAPFERDVNTVFQDYALFPTMDVLNNVAYGLMVKGVGKKERLARAEEALSMVALADYGSRKPGELSGGQRQRVALARALVGRPRVLLLDEPLGALDLKLREQMQSELKNLQRKLGITFVFVTHDQSEALSMSDRVAVFAKGRIEQIATPQDLYDKPASRFVADFVGTSNVVDAPLAQSLTGQRRIFAIRPERIQLGCAGIVTAHAVRAKGVVRDIAFLGAVNRIEVELAGKAVLTALTPSFGGALPLIGSEVELAWRIDAMHWITEAA